MTRLNTWVAAVAVGATMTGCAANSTVQDGPARPMEAAARVEVTNNNWSDMAVYVERGGMVNRLGTVTSMTSSSFRIPKTMMSQSGSLRLIADPIGGVDRYLTQPLNVWPGQRVEFKIENHLAISSIAVW